MRRPTLRTCGLQGRSPQQDGVDWEISDQIEFSEFNEINILGSLNTLDLVQRKRLVLVQH
jgi:hypothetical protein